MGKRRFHQTFQTGLPAGRYCDLVSNCQQNVTVDGSGSARLAPFSDDVAVVAFLVGQRTGCYQLLYLKYLIRLTHCVLPRRSEHGCYQLLYSIPNLNFLMRLTGCPSLSLRTRSVTS